MSRPVVVPAISGAWRQCVSDSIRPHAGKFEALTQEAEAEFDRAARRLELIGQCRRHLSPSTGTETCNYLVTPGGLSYQDAALQCLQGGCVQSLESISERAALEIETEKLRSYINYTGGQHAHRND